jgi:hypothetical protein
VWGESDQGWAPIMRCEGEGKDEKRVSEKRKKRNVLKTRMGKVGKGREEKEIKKREEGGRREKQVSAKWKKKRKRKRKKGRGGDKREDY